MTTLFSPPSPLKYGDIIKLLGLRSRIIGEWSAVVSQGTATLQTPGDSEDSGHRSTEVLMVFMLSLRRKAA